MYLRPILILLLSEVDDAIDLGLGPLVFGLARTARPADGNSGLGGGRGQMSASIGASSHGGALVGDKSRVLGGGVAGGHRSSRAEKLVAVPWGGGGKVVGGLSQLGWHIGHVGHDGRSWLFSVSLKSDQSGYDVLRNYVCHQ